MSVVQSNQVFIVNGTTVNVPTNSANTTTRIQQNQNVRRRRFKASGQQSICDLIVVLVALPTLTILGLMLESLTRDNNWLETTQSRMTVLGLGAVLAVVCLALCMYVTSRLGKRFLWVGMQFTDDTVYSYYNSRTAAVESNDLPPKYDDVVMDFDIPPPSYDSIIVDIDKLQIDYTIDKCPKEITIQHI
ncbi:hypothetical protein PVAND_009548 [Polypedilum vanderplanki]|uniref:Uncharacterized protein n=1 Tax=Polypedilum vanderplanki TaxID=319348 RepID=A0A9J6CDI6_POLVA|nr:hypothetical protein PVAND_009548 [Polypedilum vanderplanki]